MKFIKSFEEFNLSEELKYHLDNNIGISNSVFRLGSDAYTKLFEETKKYWDEGNIILNAKESWMAKNLEVGKDAVFKGEKVKLDLPSKGGNKKYVVYRNSGKKDEECNIIARKIEFGDTSLSVKNHDPNAAASYWARAQCDLAKKQNPDTAGFWSCYAASLFSKQLDLESDAPW